MLDFTTPFDPLFTAKMDRRDRALRHIRGAFMLENHYALAESCSVLGRLLTEQELVSLGWGVLRALPVEMALECIYSAMEPAGVPSSVLDFDKLDETGSARFWASQASQKELKAFAMQAFIQMAPAVMESFSKWTAEKLRK